MASIWVTLCHWFDAFKKWSLEPAQSLIEAGKWAREAVAKEDVDGQAHMALSHVHLMNRNFDDALIAGREAVQLRSNCTNANGFFGNVLHCCGDQSDAIEHITWAIRYSAVYPPFSADVLALSLLCDGNVDHAISIAHESLRLNPRGETARLVLIAGYQQCGETNKPQDHALELLQTLPDSPVSRFARAQTYRNNNDIIRFVESISSSGLPQ